jgi:hypothetical protein
MDHDALEVNRSRLTDVEAQMVDFEQSLWMLELSVNGADCSHHADLKPKIVDIQDSLLAL